MGLIKLGSRAKYNIIEDTMGYYTATKVEGALQEVWAKVLGLTGALIYQGTWDASTGSYPVGPSIGYYWIISVAGTMGGTPYNINDGIVWNGTSWDKIDNTTNLIEDLTPKLGGDLDTNSKYINRIGRNYGTSKKSYFNIDTYTVGAGVTGPVIITLPQSIPTGSYLDFHITGRDVYLGSFFSLRITCLFNNLWATSAYSLAESVGKWYISGNGLTPTVRFMTGAGDTVYYIVIGDNDSHQWSSWRIDQLDVWQTGADDSSWWDAITLSVFYPTALSLKHQIDIRTTVVDGSYFDKDGLQVANELKINGITRTDGKLYAGATDPVNSTRLNYDGYFYATRLYGTVYNDYVDFWHLKEGHPLVFGSVYMSLGKYCIVCNKRNSKASIGICSDTFGSSVGNANGELPIAVSGFVLAFVDKIYEVGTDLVADNKGKLTKARFWEKNIIAKYLYKPKNKKYKNVDVNGRCWVKVK